MTKYSSLALIALVCTLWAGSAAAEDTTKFGTCPYVLGAGSAASQVWVDAVQLPATSFSVAALKKEVAKQARAAAKNKEARCALKDGGWKDETLPADKIWLFWWYNKTTKNVGWVAARPVDTRVYLLKSTGDKAYVGDAEGSQHNRTSFRLAPAGGKHHKFKLSLRHPKAFAGAARTFDYKLEAVIE